MKLKFFVAALVLLCCHSSADATVSKIASSVGAIHDAATGNTSPTTDYYGTGNDDNFSEYGVATFNFDLSDFGGSLASLPSINYILTHNDRFFSDGSEFELFLTTDDFDASYSALSYDDSGANDPNGLDVSQFANISSLGTFSYTPEAGGTQEILALTLSASQESDLLAEITSGSDFSIVITATDINADVTFTGDDDSFEPGGQPVLAFVPEPASLLLVFTGLMGLAASRRR